MIKNLKVILGEMSRKSKKTYRQITYCLKNYKKIIPSQSAPLQVELTSKASLASKVLIYKSELEYISRCILDYTNIETGGQLFGYWTSDGVPVVLYVIGPGPHANHQGAFFNQDVNYLEMIGGILTRDFGLQHMGEWHSHHQLGLARPSGHDSSTSTIIWFDIILNVFCCALGTVQIPHLQLMLLTFIFHHLFTKNQYGTF